MKRFISTRSIMLTIVLLLGAIPVTAAERPFALHGNGVADFIRDEAGNIIGATATGSGTATHLGCGPSSGTSNSPPTSV